MFYSNQLVAPCATERVTCFISLWIRVLEFQDNIFRSFTWLTLKSVMTLAQQHLKGKDKLSLARRRLLSLLQLVSALDGERSWIIGVLHVCFTTQRWGVSVLGSKYPVRFPKAPSNFFSLSMPESLGDESAEPVDRISVKRP